MAKAGMHVHSTRRTDEGVTAQVARLVGGCEGGGTGDGGCWWVVVALVVALALLLLLLLGAAGGRHGEMATAEQAPVGAGPGGW